MIGSFKWQEDIIIPFSKEFGCTTEDLEDLFMDLLDMSSLEALHGTLKLPITNVYLKDWMLI